MRHHATITVNGRLYDALTGLPIHSDKAASHPTPAKHHEPAKTFNDIGPKRPATQHAHQAAHHPSHTAHTVHQAPQHSATLNRQAIQKPVAAQPEAAAPAPPAPTQPETTRSPLISRFAHEPQAIAHEAPLQTDVDMPNTTPLHPSIIQAMHRKAQAQAQVASPRSSKELKEMLIKERLAEVGDEQKPAKRGLFARQPRLASILASTLSLLILGGYFTYINLTNISMRVAANRAGISAEFPQYRPDGYSLNGPITYAAGEVAINYKSNTNDSGFTLTQAASNWDSQGVLDNYVRKQTTTYLTFQQRGVTVYTFNNKAAWTNGGLLYTVNGDASLSSDQILRLATSL